MFLININIENFRGIKHLSLELDKLTVLIGENNTGKTSILEALRTCLSRSLTRKASPFSDFDYYLQDANAEPTQANPIILTLTFSELEVDEWSNEIVQTFKKVIQINVDTGIQSITVKITSTYNQDVEDFVTSWDFLNLQGDTITGEAKAPKNIFNLQQYVPLFYLAALRDAAQEFQPRSPFWGPFVKQFKINDEQRKKIEAELSQLNQQILDSHEGFEAIKERLKETSKIVPLAQEEPVSIEALPERVFEMLSRTQVMLTSKTGARLPIGRHGEGTQSLAVMFLFDAFLRNRLQSSYDEPASPILALEEPEAHLHPSAVRSIAKLLKEMKGQKIVATHSGDLVSGVDLFSLRRLCRKNDEIKAFQLSKGVLTDDELDKLNYHVRATRGELLFARCWLMVEGQTDFIVFNECARILGIDLYSEGVYCVEYSQSIPEGLLKFANAFGIDWFFQADGDTEGQKYITKAQKYLNGKSEQNHIFMLSKDTIEELFCTQGFECMFRKHLAVEKQNIVTASADAPLYCKQLIKASKAEFKKAKAAIKILSEIEKEGEYAIPQEIKEIITKAVKIARQSS
jgi:putative ATP-dependent endonuclease of OLD family